MCCFSQRVISVSSTNIFARAAAQGRQILVYSMSLEANNDLAMILPLPAQTPAGEKDVQFVDLKGYPQFFDDLRLGFPIPPPTESLHMDRAMTSASKAPLEVVQVGDFEASFVPAVKDFSRLDERFRLPDNAWKDLPAYADYGFAVFKLKSGAQRIHPMAFSFLNRDNARLFFPTVHIHDGKVHGQCTDSGRHGNKRILVLQRAAEFAAITMLVWLYDGFAFVELHETAGMAGGFLPLGAQSQVLVAVRLAIEGVVECGSYNACSVKSDPL